MQIDHLEPLVPVEASFESMSFDEVVDRAWCELNKLQALCKPCHLVKTKAENKTRRLLKKQRS